MFTAKTPTETYSPIRRVYAIV